MASVACHIQKWEKNSQGNIEYFIKVTFNGREWAVRKRFRDFLKLDQHLRKDGWELQAELPAKAWWWRNGKSLLAQRLKDLQNYITILLGSTMSTENSLIREFLEVDDFKLQLARRQSLKEYKVSSKLENLPNELKEQMIAIPATSRATSVVSHNRSRSHSQSISRSRTQSTSRSSRTPSISVGGPNHYRGNSFAAAKKSSFSSASIPFSRANSHMSGLTSRGESFAQPVNGGGTAGGVGRDRKLSFDVVAHAFQLSSSQTEEAAATLMNISQRENYCSGVEALWPAYSQEIEAQITALENQDFCMPISVFNKRISSSSSSSSSKSPSKRSSKSKGTSPRTAAAVAADEITRTPANPLSVLSNLMAPPVSGSIPSSSSSSSDRGYQLNSTSSASSDLDAKIDLLFRKNEFPFITNGQRLDPRYVMLSNFGDDMISIPGRKSRSTSIALSTSKTALYEADKDFAVKAGVLSPALTSSIPPLSPPVATSNVHCLGSSQNRVKVGGNIGPSSKCISPSGRATVIDSTVEVSGRPPVHRQTSSNVSTATAASSSSNSTAPSSRSHTVLAAVGTASAITTTATNTTTADTTVDVTDIEVEMEGEDTAPSTPFTTPASTSGKSEENHNSNSPPSPTFRTLARGTPVVDDA